jgi:polyphenol oxidase
MLKSMKSLNSFQDGILTFFSPRQIDFSFPSDQPALIPQRKKDLLSVLSCIPKQIVTIKQVHETRVIKVDPDFLNSSQVVLEADGLVTDITQVALTVRTADCLAVYLFDPIRRCIGLVHAGWRGTQGQIAAKAVALMVEQYDSSLQDIRVLFGPAIRSCCYSVGKEFAEIFPGATIKRGENLFFDLAQANRLQLLAAGVCEENIVDCGYCTFCQAEFFSFRREGQSAGRHLAVLMLTD